MGKRKNVLLLLADQQRLDTVSAYGMDCICRTPHIDRLAKEGMKFRNAFCTSAICAPSRASVMTGLYAHKHGVIDNYTDIKEGTPLLSQCMADAGYYCGYAGKWHISPVKTPADCGFSDNLPFMGYGFPGSRVFPSLKFDIPPSNTPNYYEEYLKENGFSGVDVSHGFMGNNPALQIQEMFCRHEGPVESTIEYFVARETNRLIAKAKDKAQPFFIWSNFWGPHSPSIVPEPYYSMYRPEDIPEHPSYREDFHDKPYGYYLTEKMWGLSDYGWRGFQEIAARYFGHCTLIDDCVGMIVDKLKECGLYEDTVIIYSADHGDCMGAHKLIEKGAFTFDEIYRVPLVVRGLGTQDNDSLVLLQELMPSILEIGGTKPPEKVDGESLAALMEGRVKENGRKDIFCEYHYHFYTARQRMVRDLEYQFTFHENERGELYDLKKDPWMLKNVCYDSAYTGIKRRLMDRMSAYMKETEDPAGIWFERIREFY